MVIYLDLLIGSTFLVNFSFIKTISLSFKNNISFGRLLFSSVVATLSLVLFFIPFEFVWNLRHLYGLLIGILAFNDNDLKTRIIKIVSFYVLNYMFIGTLVIFEINTILFLLIVLLYIIVIYIIEHFSYISKSNIICFINNNKLKALIDTGNKCYYQNVPISFIDKKYYNESFFKIGELLTTCITTEVLVDIYIGPPIYVNKKEKVCYYAFVNLKDYDAVLCTEIGG